MGSQTATTWLDKLHEQLNVDIDCMDPAEAKKLPFVPMDQTSNQRLVYQQMVAPENRELFLAVAKELKEEGWKAIYFRMAAELCALNIGNLRGRVLLQSSPFHAYDTEKVIDDARSYVKQLEKVGIMRDRVCIKIPCTGPALNAGRILLKEGIRTLGTSLFGLPQAIAASQAGCLSISPYFNLPWFHYDPTLWPDVEDPALEHPMSPRMVQIVETYRRLHKETGQPQPLLKPASFRSAKETMAMAEFGCEHATIPEDILSSLASLDLVANPPPGDYSTKHWGVPNSRLAHLINVDPLAGPDWDGKLASTDVDYLANNGAALDKAIEDDDVTKRGLALALKEFQGNELQTKAAIEEVLKEIA
ncbi:uncharacterized protein PV09_03268 [Verruconis gallopava]|uniref:Transaldolase n=1 Tax=Verruconis gallopava TaxID=253628 RepID=A0A0D2B4E8_9PEZI|nr:uncharacterized protein PV09_03268 [Verruconis gallopava]KIW06099.1 hypothetical protein PV09_03268 [Verruconis gallopava]